MMLLPSSVRIYLAREPADMRKSIDGLSALVQLSLKVDIYSGHLFVFLSKRRDRAKILYWDNGGFALFYKRLKRGCFQRPVLAKGGEAFVLEASQLTMLLDGLEVLPAPSKRWLPPR